MQLYRGQVGLGWLVFKQIFIMALENVAGFSGKSYLRLPAHHIAGGTRPMSSKPLLLSQQYEYHYGTWFKWLYSLQLNKLNIFMCLVM